MKEPLKYQFNTSSGNDLVPSGNKPLPDPVFTKFYDVIWHHYAIVGQAELKVKQYEDICAPKIL